MIMELISQVDLSLILPSTTQQPDRRLSLAQSHRVVKCVLMELDSFIVGVQPEYLIYYSRPPPPVPSSYPEQPSGGDGSNPSRKRQREADKISPEDRICQKTIAGLPCPFGGSCKYR